MSEQCRIFVVEDDESIRNLTRMHLKMNSFNEVYSASDAEGAWVLAKRVRPDIVLLDLMLPGISGLTLLKWFRSDAELHDVIVIIITAKDGEEDVVAGLEAGADDYITKPFSSKLLLARLGVQLRRIAVRKANATTVSLGGLEIDSDSRIVRMNGEKISMTADEFDTLNLLVRNPEKVYTRRQIIDNVKGGDYPVTDRVVDIRMVKLRRKLGSWAEHLITVRGVGYKITGF